MIRKVFFLLVLIGSVMSGCTTEKRAVPIQLAETVGNLAYEVRLDKNHYGVNEEIEVHAKVTNIGNDGLLYVSGSSSCPINIGININHSVSKKDLAYKPDDDRICTADTNQSILAPGQTIEQTLFFVPKYYGSSDLESAVPGTYEVFVALDQTTREPVKTSITIQ